MYLVTYIMVSKTIEFLQIFNAGADDEYYESTVSMDNSDYVLEHLYKPQSIAYSGKNIRILFIFPAFENRRKYSRLVTLNTKYGIKNFTYRYLLKTMLDAYTRICIERYESTEQYAFYEFTELIYDRLKKCYILEFYKNSRA